MEPNSDKFHAKIDRLYAEAEKLGGGEAARNILNRHGLEREEPQSKPVSNSTPKANPFEGTRPFVPTDGRSAGAESLRRGAQKADRYRDAVNKYGQGSITDLSVTNIASDLDEFTHVNFGGKDWEEQENFDPKSEDIQPLVENLNPAMQERFYEEAVSEEHARDLSKRLKREQDIYTHASTSIGASFLANMLSLTRDPVFLGTTVATMGAGSGVVALTRGIQMAHKTRGAIAMAEVVGTTATDAAIYGGIKNYTNDNYTAEDAMVEVGYSLLFAAPLGGAVGGLTARSSRKGAERVEKTVDTRVVADAADVAERTPGNVPLSLKPQETNSLIDTAKVKKRADKRAKRRVKRNPELILKDEKAKAYDEIMDQESSSLKFSREFDESKEDVRRAAETMVDANSRAAVYRTFEQMAPIERLNIIKKSLQKQADDEDLPNDLRSQASRELGKITEGNSKWTQRVEDDGYWKFKPEEEGGFGDEVHASVRAQDDELDDLEGVTQGAGESWAGKIHRQDLYGTIQKSLSKTMRGLGHILYSNPIRSKNQPQGVAADLLSQGKANGIIEQTNYRLAKRVQQHMKDNNISLNQINKQYDLTEEMGDQVFDIVITGQRSGNPVLDEAADILRERVAMSARLAKRYGVEGSDEWSLDANFLPRMYKPVAVQKELNKAGGEKRLVSAFRNGLQEANETLPKAAAELIARGMVKALRRDKMESLDDIFKDKEKMREVLQDIAQEDKAVGQSADDYLEEVFEVLADRKANKQVNKKDYMDRMKKRADLNIFARSDAELGEQIALRDIMNTNAFAISEQYTREMAGEAALASKGLSGPGKIRAARQKIKDELIKEEMDQAVINKELRRFDDMIDNVRNKPTHFKGMTAKQKAAMSATLQYNSVVMLGMAGLAGMAEFVGGVFRGGVAATLKAVPVLRENSVALAREIEKQGFAMDKMYYNMYFNHYEETGLYGATTFAARLGHSAMKTVSTVSLMRGFDQFARRTLWTVALDKSAAQAKKNGKLFFTKEELGLSQADYDRVAGHMAGTVETSKGVFGDSVNTLKFEKWLRSDGEVDEELIDKFLSGMYRMSSNQTLRVLSGERVRWTERPLGQFLFQFQTLLLSGIYKSLGNKMANMDQLSTYTTFMGEVMGGTLWYMGRNQIKMAGMSDEKRREWEENHMTTDKIALGGLGYTTSFGGAFSLYNKASTPFGYPAIGQRYANSAADALVANPTLSMVESGAQVFGDLTQGKADDNTMRNFMNLVPLKSFYAAYPINNLIMDE